MSDTNPLVMVAEDDKFLMKIYETKLKKEGIKIVTASDGVEAVEMAKKHKPQLILLDLIMPKKTGFDVLKEIKADETLKDTPVIILSNLGQESDRKKGMELGATDFVVKANMSIQNIIEKIKQYTE
jgi:DNA-binding response OmpR family regulator